MQESLILTPSCSSDGKSKTNRSTTVINVAPRVTRTWVAGDVICLESSWFLTVYLVYYQILDMLCKQVFQQNLMTERGFQNDNHRTCSTIFWTQKSLTFACYLMIIKIMYQSSQQKLCGSMLIFFLAGIFAEFKAELIHFI